MDGFWFVPKLNNWVEDPDSTRERNMNRNSAPTLRKLISKEMFIEAVVCEWFVAVTTEAMRFGPDHPKYSEYMEGLRKRAEHMKMLADELRLILQNALDRYEESK